MALIIDTLSTEMKEYGLAVVLDLYPSTSRPYCTRTSVLTECLFLRLSPSFYIQ